MPTNEIARATGRRKTSTARIFLVPGDGSVRINERSMEDYFPRDTLRTLITKPLVLTEKQKALSVVGSVDGGGVVSQAGAVAHGIARALLKMDNQFRAALKKEGFLTRDSRMKERKKYGQKGARKRFQYSKR